MNDKLKALIEDLRLNHEFCPEEVILQAADELERMGGHIETPLEAKDEPLAWMVYTQDGQYVYVTDNPDDIQESQRALPLYTKAQAEHMLMNIGPSSFMSYQEGMEAGRLAEREACAKICDEMQEKAEEYGTECCKWPTPSDCAYAIRARGDKND
jgi:hypothetical protein